MTHKIEISYNPSRIILITGAAKLPFPYIFHLFSKKNPYILGILVLTNVKEKFCDEQISC